MTQKTSAGIEKLKTCIRIWWKIDGTRHRETLHNTPPTPENCQKAQAMADMIATQIEMGIFNRHQVFPNSPKRPEAYFGFYIQKWQSVDSQKLAKISYDTYLSKVTHHITPYWSQKQIAKITVDDIENWVYKILAPNLSTKTIKEIIMLWRKIYSYWARHQKNNNDPAQYIQLGATDAEDIDPFSKEEIANILNTSTDPTLHNLWTVMLWSGLSFHELISLVITDLDLDNGWLYVNRSYVTGEYRVTKNRRRKRQVELLPNVIEALRDQIQIAQTYLPQSVTITDRDNKKTKTYQLQFLWIDPILQKHYTYSQLTKRWKKHLEACEVRYRPLNNGRHTYASQVLSSGAVSAEWLANQLGHANTDMIHRHYGKFIPKDASHIIRQLANALNNKTTD